MSIGMVTSQKEVPASVHIASEMRALFRAHRGGHPAEQRTPSTEAHGDTEATNWPHPAEPAADPENTAPHPDAMGAPGSDANDVAEPGAGTLGSEADDTTHQHALASAPPFLPEAELDRLVLRRDGYRPLVFKGLSLVEMRRAAGQAMDDGTPVAGTEGLEHRFGLYIAADGTVIGALSSLVGDTAPGSASECVQLAGSSHAARPITSRADIDALVADAEPVPRGLPATAADANQAIRARALFRGELSRLVDDALSARPAGELPTCIEGMEC